MKCRSCGHDNLPEARFCAHCGSLMDTLTGAASPGAGRTACPACGYANYPAASYCSHCGSRLDAAAVPSRQASVAYAGFWVRLGATVIDLLILTLAIIVTSSILGAIAGREWAVVGDCSLFLLYFWLLTGLRGQTIGKMGFNIIVVRDDGSVPGLGYAALREIVGKIISTAVILLGFFWFALDDQHQGWHDMMAGTHVVRKESGRWS